MMSSKQMDRWANIQVAVTEAGFHEDGLTFDQIANAIADNYDVVEIRRLIHSLEAEIEKKSEEEVIIH